MPDSNYSVPKLLMPSVYRGTNKVLEARQRDNMFSGLVTTQYIITSAKHMF